MLAAAQCYAMLGYAKLRGAVLSWDANTVL